MCVLRLWVGNVFKNNTDNTWRRHEAFKERRSRDRQRSRGALAVKRLTSNFINISVLNNSIV